MEKEIPSNIVDIPCIYESKESYEYYEGNLKTARKSLNAYISDGMIIYDYFVNLHSKLIHKRKNTAAF